MFSRVLLVSSAASRSLTTIKRNIFLSGAAKSSSTSSKQNNDELVKIVVDPQTKIGTLTLNRLPANALSAELMVAIKDSIKELERQNVLGMILTSSSERIFCAGLDLTKVYNQDEENLIALWTALQNMWKALFTTKLPTAALINGHAVAGGCVLTNCCDYRVMLPKLTIGLNETRAGIAVPKFVMDTYVNVMPSRRIAEADMIEGRCYKSEDALQVGLVDAVVDTRQQALDKCMEFLKSFEGPTKLAKAQTKSIFRADIVRDFEKNRQNDLNMFLSGVQRKEVQEFLGSYLKSLGKKSPQKNA